jgi:hypothetical protein
LTSIAPTASSISLRERMVLLAPKDELADRGHAGLAHRLEQEGVRTPLGVDVGRREVVRAVEVDGIDVGEIHEADDLDRLGALERDPLEIALLHEDVLTLGELPALDQLLGRHLPIVRRAPALLLDRRPALAVQRPERDVGPLGGNRQPDRDVDEAEAD